MNTQTTFPYRLGWSAQDIADAVPRRLFELFAFDADLRGHGGARGANPLPAPRRWRGGYHRQAQLPARWLVR